MTTKEKLPVNLTFEIEHLPEPNHRWYHVTGVLSWEAYLQRMNTCLVLQDELSDIKNAICFIVGEQFAIHEVKEDLI